MSPRLRSERPSFPGPASAILCALLGLSAAWADSVVVFNEIQYHPDEAAAPEWIEFHNQMAIDVDVSSWRLRGGVDYEFPAGTVVPAGGYLVVSGDPATLGRGALGPWEGKLSNGGEELRLRNNSGRLMDEIDFGDRGVWPIGPDGSGATLAKEDEDTASSEPEKLAGECAGGRYAGHGEFSPSGDEWAGGRRSFPSMRPGATTRAGWNCPTGWAASSHAVGAGGLAGRTRPSRL